MKIFLILPLFDIFQHAFLAIDCFLHGGEQMEVHLLRRMSLSEVKALGMEEGVRLTAMHVI